MSQTKVVLTLEGFDAVRSSPEIHAILEDLASGIAMRAGTGYSYDVLDVESRTIASAYTETVDAMRDQLKNNTLLKAVNG